MTDTLTDADLAAANDPTTPQEVLGRIAAERADLHGALAVNPSTYDELLDCPIECGDFVDLPFTARRRPHRIVISGGGNIDAKALVKETRRIVETTIDFWGGAPPYRHYTFICHVFLFIYL